MPLKQDWYKRVNGENIPFKKPRLSYSALGKLTPFQIAKNKERRKVRKGERQEVWEKRVRDQKLMSDKEVQRFLKGKRVKIHFQKLENIRKRKIKKIHEVPQKIYSKTSINVSIHEKEFNFLKYYGLMTQIFCLRHGIRKDDLEIMLFLYDGTLFNKDRFYQICKSTNITRNPITIFKNFVKEEYISRIVNSGHIKVGVNKAKKRVSVTTTSEIFKLNRSLIKKIHTFYQVLAQRNTIPYRAGINMCPPEIVEEIEKMNIEIQAILVGDIPQIDFKN